MAKEMTMTNAERTAEMEQLSEAAKTSILGIEEIVATAPGLSDRDHFDLYFDVLRIIGSLRTGLRGLVKANDDAAAERRGKRANPDQLPLPLTDRPNVGGMERSVGVDSAAELAEQRHDATAARLKERGWMHGGPDDNVCEDPDRWYNSDRRHHNGVLKFFTLQEAVDLERIEAELDGALAPEPELTDVQSDGGRVISMSVAAQPTPAETLAMTHRPSRRRRSAAGDETETTEPGPETEHVAAE